MRSTDDVDPLTSERDEIRSVEGKKRERLA